MTACAKRLRARWVLPVDAEPIENGEVVVRHDCIEAVGVADDGAAQPDAADDICDLGDAIIMPGLVNVHTHLDYTVMRGLLEDMDFGRWIGGLQARKAALPPADWIASATLGAAEAVAGGVTTIGDCTDSGAAAAGARTLGLRGIIYQEVFGIDTRQSVAEIIAELNGKVDALQSLTRDTLLRVGISPHAPYTVRAELMRALAALADAHGYDVCIHAAESQAEAELLRCGTGPIADMFARRGIAWDAPRTSTVAYLDSLGVVGPRTLLVHGVQVSARDRDIVRARGAAWAHCPKSNAKLGNGVAPLGILADFRRETGADEPRPWGRIGLGSDSVASNNTMDMFEEMRFALLMQRGARHRIEAMTAREAVHLATIGGAQALNMAHEIGSLTPGKQADLCVVRLGDLHSLPAYDPYNALVYAARASDVILTMIGGAIRYDARQGGDWRNRFPDTDLRPALAQLHTASAKMRAWAPPT